MDISSDTTPKAHKRRTLGLSRRVDVNKSKLIPISPIETIPDSSHTFLERCKDETIPISAIETTPHSAHASLQRCNSTAAVSNEGVSDLVNSRIAGYTSTVKPNIVRHKLSLCKDTNATMTRKRLLSHKAESVNGPKRLKLDPDSELINERSDEPKSSAKIENCDTKPLSDEVSGKMNTELSSETLLQKEIDRMKKQIATTEKYQQQIFELRELIAKWKAAGLKTIEDIQEKIQPTEVSDILSHFNIDPELFELNSAK